MKNSGGEIIRRLARCSLVNNWTAHATLEALVLDNDVHQQLPTYKFSNSDILGFVSRYFLEEDYPKLKNMRSKFNHCVPNVQDIPPCTIPKDAYDDATLQKYKMLQSLELYQ